MIHFLLHTAPAKLPMKNEKFPATMANFAEKKAVWPSD